MRAGTAAALCYSPGHRAAGAKRVFADGGPAEMDKRLLDIICCPATHLPLELLAAERLSRLNAAIAGGTIRNQGEQLLADSLAEALVTSNGHFAYPVRDGMPILLDHECIDLRQLSP